MDNQQNNNGVEPINQAPENPLKRKSKSCSLILITILGILLLLAISFIIWQNYFTDKQPLKTADIKQEKTMINSIDTNYITGSIIKNISTKYNLLPYNMQQLDNSIGVKNQVYIKSSNRAPMWYIKGTDKMVDYSDQHASSLSISTNSAIDDQLFKEQYHDIGNFILLSFKENGLSFDDESSSVISREMDVMFSIDIYKKGDIICATSYIAGTSNASSIIDISCGEESKYTTDLSSYKIAKPFFEAYGDKLKRLSVEDMVVKAGKDGYVNTSLSFFNAAHSFYKPPNGQWTYFSAHQQALNCKDFNTDELKSAFAYELCFSESDPNSTTTMVSRYYNL